jgi:hypothetical protein
MSVRAVSLFLLAVTALAAPAIERIPFADARASIDAHRDALPVELRSLDSAALPAAWPAWVAKRDAEIRGRLARGDEDSVVNLWLYGTSFTRLPRVTARQTAQLAQPDAIEDLLVSRLDDFVAALARPGNNERLQFARDLIARQRIDLSTPTGRKKAEEYLVAIRERTIVENRRYARDAESPDAYATLFHDRGLSSDTRLTASFAIDRALDALAAAGRIAPGTVARAAIVGPGLDFTDKAEGYDFYPPQTIQPFALVESLLRGKLSASELRLTTLDLSPRVNGHLDAARSRAARGTPYVIELPLAKDQTAHAWQPQFIGYWERFGAAIGKTVPAVAPPPLAGDVRVRAVAVRAAIVSSITPRDVNIIVERVNDEPFDLIVATNILVYYDGFEQSLALANIARMLKPGGFFLTNYAVTPLPPLEPTASQTTRVFFDRSGNGDTIYAYQRR